MQYDFHRASKSRIRSVQLKQIGKKFKKTKNLFNMQFLAIFGDLVDKRPAS